MANVFNSNVAVHRSPTEVVWFAPGDEVPDWALELVGDHAYGDADGAEDVRLTDPHLEADDPATQFTSPNTFPPVVGGDAADEDMVNDYSGLKKDELIALCDDRDLDTDGTKAELIARLEADDEDDEEE